MNKFKEMFHYGCFEKRIIITIIEYVMASIIWIVIDQFITYSLFVLIYESSEVNRYNSR